ncbi:FAD/NAD(P)-binding protein [Sphaerisporangium flaviroseum]|uniref:FAD/NAD(P)-binding protein n=1 Tax=Sphaerisporangium flaviroseum TaxID=509199 RepID=A0ABP7HE46_9ACTN
MADSPSVIVVGGGASGTLAAVHLLREARARAIPLEIVLIDQHGRHATGQAYSTTDPCHLLNACAAKMSALDDDPGHLLRWAHDNGLAVDGSDYLPREAYGRYLRDTLAEAEDRPARVLRKVTGTASALSRDPGPRVHLSDRRQVDADAVVLALGNGPPATWSRIADIESPRHIADPWAPNALTRIRDGAPVLVLGTGLTMVDVAITVTRAHPDTVVYAVSRHALLPQPQPQPVPPAVPVSIPDGPLGLGDLLRAVRSAVKDNEGDWPGVVDGLRPQVQRLWARLSPAEQQRFLSLAARYWEVHRHRIPPATAARVAGLRAAGRLRVLRGQVVRAAIGPAGLRVHVAADDTGQDLDVGWLVNATGPGSRIDADPLVTGLVAGGLARPDRLRLGLEADPYGAVLDATGRPQSRIYTLGPPLRGSLYETTAIPEIRAQAAALAPRLIEAAAWRG